MIQLREYTVPHAEAKTARKELKLQPSILRVIQAAARYVGMDVSTFIATAAYTQAKAVEMSQFTTPVSDDQFAAFQAAVDRQGKANDVLAGSIAKSRTLFVDA